LHFIKTAKRLGFSLDETAQLLQLDDGASCVQARMLTPTEN
jgi:MerR family mercuric resistance operon transcriptional regulator